jgi:peptidoglycan/LPS O-acetylase OafA/YrhL
MLGLTQKSLDARPDASAGAAASLSSSSPARLAWLDPARGVAILFVVAYHSFGYLQKTSSFHGEAGVDAFLLLSGFGLAYATRAEPWGAFVWRRLKRLLPAYWIVLALCVLAFWSRGVDLGWRQVVLHATCLHLAWGGEYGFGISMSWWFVGLIVPLYLWFALLRPWLLDGRAYVALGVSLGLAAIGGQLLLKFYPQWGNSEIGHVPHRLPQFFLGAIIGLAYARRDPPERLAREPWLLLGAATFVGMVVWFDWILVAFFSLAGAGIVSVGMLVSAAAERRPLMRPLAGMLAVVGGLAYEVYLCHQFILTAVLPSALMPRLEAWLPRVSHGRRAIVLAIAAFAVSLWVAWVLRWIVAPRDSRRGWRPAVRTLAALTAAAAVAIVPLARPQPPPKTRTFELSITVPQPPVPVSVEPIISFGVHGAADSILMEHDGRGLARFRIDHWGHGPVFSDWRPAAELTAGKVNVVINGDFLELRGAAVGLRCPIPPYDPKAWPAVGINQTRLTDVAPAAVSQVVLSPKVVRMK